jgi:3-ketosteroid 9alpha-monooxygenase subunit A
VTEAASVYPRGWFGIAFSDEIPVGETRALKYFGRSLAAWRGHDGRVRVLDAHCPHMGAHLAVKGKVAGDCIQCPFHGWRFDGEGRCVEIPYARAVPPKARQPAWRVREVNGVVLVHFDPSGGEPQFDVPVIPEFGGEGWLPWATSQYHIKTHPREVVDNLADKAHFAFVHTTEIDEFRFECDGITATQHVRGRALLANGGVDAFSSRTTYFGPAYLLMRMDGALQNYMILLHTPVDENSLDLRLGVMLKIVGSRERTEGYVKGYLDNLRRGFEDDLEIWEHKVYRDPPLLCDGDGPIGKLRRWYRQFYVPESQPKEQRETMENNR